MTTIGLVLSRRLLCDSVLLKFCTDHKMVLMPDTSNLVKVMHADHLPCKIHMIEFAVSRTTGTFIDSRDSVPKTGDSIGFC
jgi:hypothetical protein